MVEALRPKLKSLEFVQDNGIDETSSAMTLMDAIQDKIPEDPETCHYFFNEQGLRQRYQTFHKHFLPEDPRAHVAFAIKANAFRRIVELFTDEGMTRADCASPKEIQLLKSINPDAVPLYNHPTKKRKHITESVLHGTRHITVQTLEELEKVIGTFNNIAIPSEMEIAVRLKTTNPHAAIDLSKKFGAITQEAQIIIDEIRRLGLRIGISIHTGSQNSSVESMRYGVKKMAELVNDTGRINTLNVGGGFPVPYLGENKSYNSLQTYLNGVSATIREVRDQLFEDNDYSIFVEPGRSLVADQVQLVIPVVARESKDGVDSITMDDGIYGSFHPADSVNYNTHFEVLRMSPQGEIFVVNTDDKKELMVYGNSCDCEDHIGQRVLPSDTKEGDWLLHTTAGAYAEASRTDFNGLIEYKHISYNI